MALTDQDKIQRGIDARALLETPLIVEAFARLESDTVDAIANAKAIDIPMMAALTERLRVIRGLKQELQSIVNDAEQVKLRKQRESEGY